jgi:putative DNA primase/helicase
MDRSGYAYVTCFKGCNALEIRRLLNVGPSERTEADPAEEARREAERIKRQEDAAAQAQKLMGYAKMALHPYISRKGFHNLKVPVLRSGKAVFPLKDEGGKVWSVQTITPDGEKRFLKGGRLGGCAFRIGHNPEAPRVLCEGVATGLSIWRAARSVNVELCILCCMSTYGLQNAGTAKLVCADRDEHGAGERAAKKTGIPYVMPPNHNDFNDLELSCGTPAVWEVLRPHLI